MKEKNIKIEGFQSLSESPKRLVIAAFGIQGAGKTRFGITAPDPIGIIPTNRKTRATAVEMQKELDKVVILPEKDFIRHASPMEIMALEDPKDSEQKKVKQYYAQHVRNMMMAAYRLAQHPDIRTIVIDDFSQFCEDVLFKHFGRTWRIIPRDRGAFNQDIIDFINAISNKHVILTHKQQEIWSGGDDGKPTGRFKAKGFGDIGYHCNVVIEMKKNLNWSENGHGPIPWKYSLDIKDCQANPELEGPQGKDLLTDDLINFTQLACAIYPDDDPKEFM